MKQIPSHSQNDFTDKESVSLIENTLAHHKRVMSKLYSSDKWPNIDGHIEVQDVNNILVGRSYVQVKTLPVNHNLKFACPVSFFSSCELEPCFLFGVDNQNGRVYWLYFDAHVIKEIDFEDNTSTKTIEFNESQYFDKNKTDYVEAWEKIIKDNQQKFKHYNELKTSYELILSSSNRAIGKTDKNFSKIHLFLDELNNKLDHQFQIVKDIFYPRTWKIGLAYYDYEGTTVSYTPFPIPIDQNDVQIKEVDNTLRDKLKQQGLGFTGHFAENPIEVRPREYAKEIIGSKMTSILERQLLNHKGHELLAQETVFNFINSYHDYLDLPKKDSYSVEEVKSSNELMRMKNTSLLSINARHINLSIFWELLNFLESKQLPISRVYRAKDFSRIPNGGWVWDVFSKSDTEHNLNIVFDNLPSAYEQLIFNNFPLLKEEFSLFQEADKILVRYKLKERYTDYGSGPTYEMFYLKADSGASQKSIEVIGDSEADVLNKLFYSGGPYKFEYKGIQYTLLSVHHSVLDFIYDDTPLFKLVYEILLQRVKQYFEKSKQEQSMEIAKP